MTEINTLPFWGWLLMGLACAALTWLTMAILCQRQLTRFCRDWWTKAQGLDTDHLIWVSNRQGLCVGIIEWAAHNDGESDFLAQLVHSWWLPKLFKARGLHAEYPFNDGNPSAYFGECQGRRLHLNPARRKFVYEQTRLTT